MTGKYVFTCADCHRTYTYETFPFPVGGLNYNYALADDDPQDAVTAVCPVCGGRLIMKTANRQSVGEGSTGE
ncbi:MAG: hypothetical protein JXQ27_15885 [Acidobacteria bacterium]|nr:hypothetical protein [Acidobacteriota bacterium]